VLSDGALARRLSANGRKRVERHFTWDAAARKTFDIYKRLCR
jgi:glycosyltransferase involved in cell wall biosynthesis